MPRLVHSGVVNGLHTEVLLRWVFGCSIRSHMAIFGKDGGYMVGGTAVGIKQGHNCGLDCRGGGQNETGMLVIRRNRKDHCGDE